MLIGILTDAREASKVALTKPDLCTLVFALGSLDHETPEPTLPTLENNQSTKTVL